MEAAARELKIRVDLHPSLLSITDDALFDYHLVFMHGRNSFPTHRPGAGPTKDLRPARRHDPGRLDLRNKAFTDSFRREMAAIFPDHPLGPIPADDPLLGRTYGGFDLSKVSRRDPQPGGAGGALKVAVRLGLPELEGIKFGGRYRVIFSPFDLSCAGEARFPGVPRLPARGRRPDRSERAPLFVAGVAARTAIQGIPPRS